MLIPFYILYHVVVWYEMAYIWIKNKLICLIAIHVSALTFLYCGVSESSEGNGDMMGMHTHAPTYMTIKLEVISCFEKEQLSS